MNIVLDIDGTICFDGHHIDVRIVEALCDLMDLGHKVILASARPIRDMMPVLDERLKHIPLVGGNGSIVSVGKQIVHKESISEDNYKKILEIWGQHKCSILVDDEWDYGHVADGREELFERIDGYDLAENLPLTAIKTPIKVLLMSIKDGQAIRQALDDLDLSISGYEKLTQMDITSPGINKFSGLKWLGIQDGDYVCFGNDSNDIPLFKHSSYGVQVGNHTQLAEISDEQIPVDHQIVDKLIGKLKGFGQL